MALAKATRRPSEGHTLFRPGDPSTHLYGCACRSCRREARRARYHASLGTHARLDERAPTGEPGKLTLAYHPHMGRSPYRDGTGKFITFSVPDIRDLLSYRPQPWNLVIWERLFTKAPGPHLVRPYCCYINTIIFYARPYQTLPPKRYLSWHEFSETERYANGNRKLIRLARPVIRKGSTGSFAEYDRLEHRLEWGTLLKFEDEQFEYGGGSVRWVRPHWWMRSQARRVRP